jgi:hypothetical protein
LTTDIEILRKAYDHENDTRRPVQFRSWEYYAVGATKKDIGRLFDEGLIEYAYRRTGLVKYKLTRKGNDLVKATFIEHQFTKIPAESVLGAMDLIVGFDDLKEAIAYAIEVHHRVNFLLEGPPACAKSLMLEGVRAAVPGAYIAFGSRTSAAGLSDALFEFRPSVLLLDEADKMNNDVYAVLLGLMESGEILETKSRKTRGIKLETMVIAACNSSAKMPREFLSRFALHAHFPKYSRGEFIEVCRGFLTRADGCKPELAQMIGAYIFDLDIGDVRKARGVWQLMTAPTEKEVKRVVQLMLKYSPSQGTARGSRRQISDRLPGM